MEKRTAKLMECPAGRGMLGVRGCNAEQDCGCAAKGVVQERKKKSDGLP